ncbi:MAG: RecX family transcriptional regulator [Chlorobi bacterium]|nr:RecX family transcriptional regulator [Chlorobiota bacterium]
MLVTKIEKQKKNRKRWNIYVNDEFFCGLFEDTILKYGLRKDDDVPEGKLNEIKDFDEYIYAKKISYDFLSYRIRTVSEIKKKLKSKKISGNTIDKVLAHLNELRLTNDEEFAKQLIREKISRKPVGRKLLKQKLFEKGVPKSVSEDVIEKVFNEIDEKSLEMENFKKYFVKIKAFDKKEQKKKTFDYLVRKGFDYDVINEIIYKNIK